MYGTTTKSVRKILKEKHQCGTLFAGPYTRVTYTAYEKLSLPLKDEIRKKVIKKGKTEIIYFYVSMALVFKYTQYATQ